MKNKKVKMKNKKHIKIRYDRILLFLIIVVIIILFFTFLFNLKITNIYIINNNRISDQEIIELAEISDYPSTLKNSCYSIEKKLEKSDYIKTATVKKKWLTQVFIEIEENIPLFYYQVSNETVLLDGRTVSNKFSIPTVLNYITDSYYNKFITEMGKLDIDILYRISEIQFSPNDVDDNRFLLTMNDGNYVYINISTFYKLNNYISILENFPNKKGILYLDYGNNFEIIE